MRRFFRMLKICFLIAVTLSAVLSLASCGDAYNAEYEEKLEELIYQKQKLIDERDNLDFDMEKEQIGRAHV